MTYVMMFVSCRPTVSTGIYHSFWKLAIFPFPAFLTVSASQLMFDHDVKYNDGAVISETELIIFYRFDTSVRNE